MDSNIYKVNKFYSDEVYNGKGKLLSKKYIEISPDSSIQNRESYFYFLNNSNNSIYGWVENGDSVYSKFIIDTLGGFNYILTKKDTMKISKVSFSNNTIIYDSCIFGCDIVTKCFYSKSETPDSCISVSRETTGNKNENNMKYYNNFDSKNRVISEKRIDGKNRVFLERKTEYDDKKRTKKDYFVQPMRAPDNCSYELIYFDKNNIPKKKVIYISEDNNNYTYTIEYKKVK